MAPCMGPMSLIRAYSLWAGLCPEKLVKLNLSAITEASKSRRLSKTTVKKGKTTPPTGPRKATLKFEILFKYYVKGFG